MKKPVRNLRELAKLAGVSHVTVSRALNGSPAVKRTTRERIEAIAAEHGYRINPYFSELLKRRRSGTLGTIAWMNLLPRRDVWRTEPQWKQFLPAAKQRSEELGFSLDEIWCGQARMTSRRLLEILDSRRITGLILPERESILERFDLPWEQFAIVSFLSNDQRQHQWDRVLPNHDWNLRHAMEHLRRRGRSRIGMVIASFQTEETENLWLSRYERAQREGLIEDKLPPYFIRRSLPEEKANVLAWYKRHRPDAILCWAKELWPLLESHGYRVPQDIALAHMQIPEIPQPWSGVDIGRDRIARCCVETLAAKISQNERGIPPFRKTILIDGRWIDGATA